MSQGPGSAENREQGAAGLLAASAHVGAVEIGADALDEFTDTDLAEACVRA
ncbi:hypothetical protein [Gordonia westfalica]|uniref:hypothetical protein n=1 Tax=Gordonia westfalica TaxID=158898 RepID=UPI0035C83E72